MRCAFDFRSLYVSLGWIHSLTRVSRSWAHIVPNVAWSRLQLFTLNLLIKATKRVERNDGVAVLMCDFARLNISAPEAQGHYGDDYNGAVWDPTFLPPPPPPPGPGDFLPPPPSPGNIHDPLASLPGKTDVHEAEMEHGDRIAKFLGLAKNLRQIDLVGAKRRYDSESKPVTVDETLISDKELTIQTHRLRKCSWIQRCTMLCAKRVYAA